MPTSSSSGTRPRAPPAPRPSREGSVLNAGDGGHEHPSQTLVDLYTLNREVGRLGSWSSSTGISGMAGRHTPWSGPSAGSAPGSWRFRSPGLGCPEYVLARLESQGTRSSPRARGARGTLPGEAPPASLLLERGEPGGHWRPRLGSRRRGSRRRLRHEASAGAASLDPRSLRASRVDTRFLSVPAFARAIVMHPLPRTARSIPPSTPIAVPHISARRRSAFRSGWRSSAGRSGGWISTTEAPAPDRRGLSPDGLIVLGARVYFCPGTFVNAVGVSRAADGSMRCAYCESPGPA